MGPEPARPGLTWRASLWREQFLLALELLLVQPVRAARNGRPHRDMLRLRLGRYPETQVRGGIWIHAPAMGELMVADALVRALPPDLPVVITTGYNPNRRFDPASPGRVEVTAPPYHFRISARRFLRAYQPRLLVQVEAKAWSLVLAHIAGARIPACMINVFLGDRHLAALRTGLLRPLLRGVGRFGVQGEAEREALVDLGVSQQRITVTGSLKFDVAEPHPRPELEARLLQLAGGRPILVAGSVHLPEAEAVLEGFVHAGGGSRGLLVLAPRQMEWSAGLEVLCQRRGHRVVRRSALEAADRPDVVLLDSEGELPALYRLAATAFIGGSLFRWGGHNPLEAARFGVPVAVGPHTRHFEAIAEPFDRAGVWQRVDSGASLGAAWKAWLDDPGAASALGRKGQAIAASHRGALQRTLELLKPLLEGTAGTVPAEER